MFAENPEIAFVADWVYSINKQTQELNPNINEPCGINGGYF